MEVYESQLLTKILDSKVVYSYIVTMNIYIVSNVKKLVLGNLISLFSVKNEQSTNHN